MDLKTAKRNFSKMKYKLGAKSSMPGSLLSAAQNPAMKKKKNKIKSEEKTESAAEKKAELKNPKLEKKEALKTKFSGKKKNKKGGIKTSGTFHGKSNVLGHGGRAAQLKAKGVPGGVIGNLARAAGAAKGGPNYHGKKKIKKCNA